MTDSISFLGLTIGRTEFVVVVIGIVVVVAVALMLRLTSLGRQMRALADNFDLAETTGIDTNRVVDPHLGALGRPRGPSRSALRVGGRPPVPQHRASSSCCPCSRRSSLGGIGNAYGALAGGLVIGLTQEWATIPLQDDQWKVAVELHRSHPGPADQA